MENADAYIPPNAGKLVDLGGLGVHFKVRGEQTGGTFAIVEHPLDPGVLVDPHIHQHEDELSYVLKGTVWARVGDQEIEAVAGSIFGSRATYCTLSGTLGLDYRGSSRSFLLPVSSACSTK